MADSGPVVFKKLGKLKPQLQRKRHGSRDEDRASTSSSDEGESKIARSFKTKKANPFVQSSSTSSKRAGARKRESSSEDEFKEKKDLLKSDTYQSSKTTDRVGPRDMGATATLEIETEHDKDAQSQFERIQTITKDMKGKADDKVYRGMGTYGQFYEKKDTAIGNASSGLNRKGPIRAPNFVRQSVRWDYQPDICKDYKETGFCGFGDSCKFLHDRSDYKHGWELERDVAEGRYGKSDADPHAYEISDEEDQLPFKCAVCRESFTNPVVTKCKHYFCEKCALERYRVSPKCYVCEKNTGGVFNPAKEIAARLKGDLAKKRKRDKSSSSDSDKESDKEEIKETEIERLPEPVAEENSAKSSDSDAESDQES